VRGDTRREEPCPGVWLQRRVSRVCPSIPDRGGYCPWGEGLTGRGACPPPLSHHVAILTTPHPARASRSSPAPPRGAGSVCGDIQGNPCLGVALDPVLLRPIPMQWTVAAIAPGEGLTGRGACPPPLSHHVAILTTPHPARASRSSPAPSGGRGQCVAISRGKPCQGVTLDLVLPRACPRTPDRGSYHTGSMTRRGKKCRRVQRTQNLRIGTSCHYQTGKPPGPLPGWKGDHIYHPAEGDPLV